MHNALVILLTEVLTMNILFNKEHDVFSHLYWITKLLIEPITYKYMAQLWASKWLHLMLIQLWEHFKKNCSNRLLKDRFLGTDWYKMWSGLRVMKNYRAFIHVTITYIPLSSSLMKYITLPFHSSTPLVLYRKVTYATLVIVYQ